MSNASSARQLREHIASLNTMTRFVLATLALASGVYTYLGVRSLLDGDAGLVFFAAIVYSAAVSVGIYGFWTYMIRFLPEMRDAIARVSLFVVMAIGSLMIVAMSSWLNAAALAGYLIQPTRERATFDQRVGWVERSAPEVVFSHGSSAYKKAAMITPVQDDISLCSLMVCLGSGCLYDQTPDWRDNNKESL